MYKNILVLIVAAQLTSCSSAPVGNWAVERKPNQETDVKNTSKVLHVAYVANMSYPFLKSNAAAKEVVDLINQSIAKDANASNCEFDGINDYTSGYDNQTSAEILTEGPKYFSYLLSSSSYCGGAYPNHGVYPATYNLKTGKQMDLKKEFINYAKAKLALKNIYISKLGKGNEECAAAYEDFEYAHLGATNLELVVIPSVSHAETPCAEIVKVSFEQIKELIKKDSVLIKEDAPLAK